MISYEIFEDIVVEKIGRNIRPTGDMEQHRAIKYSKDSSLFMVAGPGSGKTTVMVLKILKFIFVDSVDPASIVAATFTTKAALELSSRIYNWGNVIIKSFDDGDINLKHFLDDIDLNQIIIGTLDSICFEILNRFREPGMAPPVLVDDFVANSLMLRFGLLVDNRHDDKHLENFLKNKILGSPRRLSIAKKSELLLELKNRFYDDNVDFKVFCEDYDHVGAKVACDAIGNYIKTLNDREILDYSTLENQFLVNVKEGKLKKFLDSIEVVLVDEYQDTNSLQERIYCILANAAISNGGGMVVVGDDDQSLYRFRGATVDLFVNFRTRFENSLDVEFEVIKLSNNYRSTDEIVDFCNMFVNLDVDYNYARVADKNDIISARKKSYVDYPILGIFREDLESLSEAISNFINDILYGKLDIEGKELFIDPNNGSVNDISFLFSSPKEYNSYNGIKLPYLLKKELALLESPIKIFNPRGQSLEKVDEVSILCGLILECIDPVNDVQDQIDNLPPDAVDRIKIWRERAYDYLADDPEPKDNLSLRDFVNAWQDREPKGRKKWKKLVSILDLVYKLVRWIPSMQNDVESLVYLEAITKTINQTALFSYYSGSIDFTDEESEENSVKEAIWSIFVPLATGAIDIDEDLLENLPKDRLNFMSIHQAKGLEFPLTIVDVGSEFKTNHASQRFKRFPKEGNKDCRMENELRKYSKSLKVPERSELDRSFDDLIRKYFVAFSRAQDVLLLVGLTSSIGDSIPNIATGWDRKGQWKKFNKIKFI